MVNLSLVLQPNASMLNLVCYVSLCEGPPAGAGSLYSVVHVDCSGLSTIVIKDVIVIIIIIIRATAAQTTNVMQLRFYAS